MLSKKNRLPANAMRLKEPTSFNFKHFSMKKTENDLGYLRVGVIISTKVDRLSVGRHRIKRQIMESIRLNWNLKNSYDVIIIAFPSLTKLEDKDIQEEVRQAQ